MSQGLLFVFCASMGFAVAGVVASLYQLLTSEAAEFRAVRNTLAGTFAAVLISMFGGPFIVARKVLVAFRSRQLGALPALLGLTVSGLWSTCAGVFLLSLWVAG